MRVAEISPVICSTRVFFALIFASIAESAACAEIIVSKQMAMGASKTGRQYLDMFFLHERESISVKQMTCLMPIALLLPFFAIIRNFLVVAIRLILLSSSA